MRWCRDSFAAWFTTSWLYLILWSVVLIAFSVLLYIDAIFSRELAPDSINPLSFQGMGIAYRLFAASFLMASARCAVKGVPGKWTYQMLGAFASVIVCLHAFGFGFEALSDRRDDAMAVREVVEIAETNNTELIETLRERKGQIDVDTDKAVTALNAEITQYITDGLNNDDLADDSRIRRNALQDQAIADKRAIDDQIMQLVTSGAESRTDAVEIKADSTAWHPLFVGMAQLFTWDKEPTDWAIYICAIVFIVFWVLLAESLVIFLPERIYIMHMYDAEKARRSEAAKKGWETRSNQDFTVLPQIEDKGYWESRIKKALKTRLKNPTVQGMKDTYFDGVASIHELRGQLHLRVKRGQLSQEDFDFIMREGEFAPPEQMTNGKDQTPKGDDDGANDTGTDNLPANI